MHIRWVKGVLVALIVLTSTIEPSVAGGQTVGSPCAGAVTLLHGRIIVTHLDAPFAPDCDQMATYLKWLRSADTLLATGYQGRSADVRTVRDVALASLLLRSRMNAVVIRGDSVVLSDDGQNRLHLTMMDVLDDSVVVIGAWRVALINGTPVGDIDVELDMPLWVSKDGIVFATPGLHISEREVTRQFNRARQLRRALGFETDLPSAGYYLGPRADTLLRFLGVTAERETLSALYLSPPLSVFGPISPVGGLHWHELAHVVLFTDSVRRASEVSEIAALYWGGSSNQTFADAFCSGMDAAGVDSLSPSQVDSILDGHWRFGERASVSLLVLAHVLASVVTEAKDSTWLAAAIRDTAGRDFLGTLVHHAGVEAEEVKRGLPYSFELRMSRCRD